MGLLQRHSSRFLQKSRTDSNEFNSHSIAVNLSVSKSSISATTAILSTSLTAPTTWYLPVLTKARAVFLPNPEEVPVTTTSFLSPNLARASRSALTPPMDGSCAGAARGRGAVAPRRLSQVRGGSLRAARARAALFIRHSEDHLKVGELLKRARRGGGGKEQPQATRHGRRGSVQAVTAACKRSPA